MTRRIVAAILLSVWTTLIVGGGVAYWGVRSVLLDELDATIIQRAASVMQSSGDASEGGRVVVPLEDRYLISDELGQTIARMPVAVSTAEMPEVTARTFATLGDGRRVRTLTLKRTTWPANLPGDLRPRQFKMVYSASADALDRTLSQLAWMLLFGGVSAGLFTALVARVVARRALKPLHDAAQLIRSIDVHHLDRRLDSQPLPLELRPVATTLNDMLAALQQAVEQRQQFLADASHELRTPIAALLTAMEVSLSRTRSEEQLRVTLQRCLANVRTLRDLAEHLLEQVRSERFSEDEPTIEVNVATAIGQVVSQVAPLAEQRDIRIEQKCDDQLCVKAQPHRLRGIVMNLVSNAVQHHDGSGWVRINAESSGDDFILTVSDDGPGIAAEHQARVFDAFYRISSSRESSDGHMGLGLFLVRSHVRAMGGRDDIESERGQGTSIRITLPGSVVMNQQSQVRSQAPVRQTQTASSGLHADNAK